MHNQASITESRVVCAHEEVVGTELVYVAYWCAPCIELLLHSTRVTVEWPHFCNAEAVVHSEIKLVHGLEVRRTCLFHADIWM